MWLFFKSIFDAKFVKESIDFWGYLKIVTIDVGTNVETGTLVKLFPNA